MNIIKLSIIIPFYNAEKTIEGTINSILSQDVKDVELILINDGSNDKSEEKVKNKIKNLNNCKLITLEKSNGVSNARNLGIELSKGNYIMFIDADDKIERGFLKILLNDFDNQDLILFNYKEFKNEKEIEKNLIISKGKNIKLKVSKEEVILAILNINTSNKLSTRCSSPWAKVFKKKLIEDYNIKFNTSITLGEDSLFVYEYCIRAQAIQYRPILAYWYRKSDTSLSNKYYNNMKEKDEKWNLAFKELQEKLEINDDFQIHFSLAKGILNICYLDILHRNNKKSLREKQKDLKNLMNSQYYNECNINSVMSKFNKKDRLILKLLNNKKYIILIFVFKLKKLLILN